MDLNNVLFQILALMIGLVLGSFINAVAYRVPRGISLRVPGSFCPACWYPIRWYDNIPLLSFLILRGRCRDCQKPIPIQYLLVEALGGLVVWLPVYLEGGVTFKAAVMAFLGLLLLTVALVDLQTRTIPDGFILVGLIAGVVALLTGATEGWRTALLGILAMAGVLLFAMLLGRVLFKKPSMGMGDVKLAVVIGLFLGWKLGLTALFLAFLFGAVIGLVGIATRMFSFGERIPFGPFLGLGTLSAVYWGEEILALYLGAFP